MIYNKSQKTFQSFLFRLRFDHSGFKPDSLTRRSTLVLLRSRCGYVCLRLSWTEYSRADADETVSGAFSEHFPFFGKMDIAYRDQLSSSSRQSADSTVIAGIFDSTDIHGDRVCLDSLAIRACLRWCTLRYRCCQEDIIGESSRRPRWTHLQAH